MAIKEIVAIDLNNVIGADGGLLWDIREDMLHFMRTTKGSICVMSRPTYESVSKDKRPLKNRMNIVLTRDEHYTVPEGALVAHSKEEVLSFIANEKAMGEFFGKDVFICGGEELYAMFMDNSDELIVTEIAKTFPTDGRGKVRHYPEIGVEWYAAENNKIVTESGLHMDIITYKKAASAK